MSDIQAEHQEALTTITAFQQVLNCQDLVPDRCYLRNRGHYFLVSYVNNITGLYLSQNYARIGIFISRAAIHMAEHPPESSAEIYYALVNKYLLQMVYFLDTFCSLPAGKMLGWVPAHLLVVVKQDPPLFSTGQEAT